MQVGKKKRPIIKQRMTEFKPKSPSVVSNISRAASDAKSKIVHGVQRGASKIATREEQKKIKKVITSKEVKSAIGSIFDTLGRIGEAGQRFKKAQRKKNKW